jgi:hypothetical protein
VASGEGAVVIAFDDDRVERWTPIGQRIVVEHWYPADSFPCATPVLGIAHRALTHDGVPVEEKDHSSALPIDDGRQAFFKAIAEGRFHDVAQAIRADPQDGVDSRSPAASAGASAGCPPNRQKFDRPSPGGTQPTLHGPARCA